MEIERKWIVSGWPAAELPLLAEQEMEQGYLTVAPAVRVRREQITGGKAEYVLCLKSGQGIARNEIEMKIEKEKFDAICDMIGQPLIHKLRRTYLLPDGHHLEVNHVDEGRETEFWYAEIEYESVGEAAAWRAEAAFPNGYLAEDVTEKPDRSMAAYWTMTRLAGGT